MEWNQFNVNCYQDYDKNAVRELKRLYCLCECCDAINLILWSGDLFRWNYFVFVFFFQRDLLAFAYQRRYFFVITKQIFSHHLIIMCRKQKKTVFILSAHGNNSISVACFWIDSIQFPVKVKTRKVFRFTLFHMCSFSHINTSFCFSMMASSIIKVLVEKVFILFLFINKMLTCFDFYFVFSSLGWLALAYAKEV